MFRNQNSFPCRNSRIKLASQPITICFHPNVLVWTQVQQHNCSGSHKICKSVCGPLPRVSRWDKKELDCPIFLAFAVHCN